MGSAPWEETSSGAADERQAPRKPPDQGIPAQRSYGEVRDTQPPYAPEHGGLIHNLAHSAFAGFIPWILYWVIGGPSTWETAAIAALLAAVLLAVLGMERRTATASSARIGLDFRRLKLLDAATIVFFAALVIVALVTNRHDVATLDKYSQALSSGVLGLIALGSILVGHPFTIDYAKEQAPPEVWHTAGFKKVNLVLTSVWTVIFLVCGGLGLLAVHVSAKGLQDWLNWYIPIVLIIIGIRLNGWYPNYVRSKRIAAAPSEAA
jgi:hypothetical protein